MDGDPDLGGKYRKMQTPAWWLQGWIVGGQAVCGPPVFLNHGPREASLRLASELCGGRGCQQARR